ncbi:VOC family protein [Amycolatopsis jiangsuensis]|uniref:Catechol 2,3-dioxygenase-like lactoylglutathione lyase family enzyme n=1 Tax=Amycolatopsis jiangsuensis TaxID=1181879 RepID=A0A840IQS8_9PSEU|nr:VOC family protein [Amycolatopsis jiangsuensis]MBB4684183.1 catechol 2,3-dioxygenase-like lactoylglutathione lyase family enzyme [Amycolatopsis jiangsuensis]
MSSRLIAIAIDCRDADALAEFWREALDYPLPQRWEDSHGRTYVELKAPDRPSILFQPVPEGKAGKNRLHLDVAPDQLDQRSEVERLVTLGARVLEDPPDDPWIVLADPGGNEFCVLPARS